jgi:hypothetical protein
MPHRRLKNEVVRQSCHSMEDVRADFLLYNITYDLNEAGYADCIIAAVCDIMDKFKNLINKIDMGESHWIVK